MFIKASRLARPFSLHFFYVKLRLFEIPLFRLTAYQVERDAANKAAAEGLEVVDKLFRDTATGNGLSIVWLADMRLFKPVFALLVFYITAQIASACNWTRK